MSSLVPVPSRYRAEATLYVNERTIPCEAHVGANETFSRESGGENDGEAKRARYLAIGEFSPGRVPSSSASAALEEYLAKGTDGIGELLCMVRDERNGEQLEAVAQVLGSFDFLDLCMTICTSLPGDLSESELLVLLRAIEATEVPDSPDWTAAPADFVRHAFSEGMRTKNVEMRDAAALAASSFEASISTEILREMQNREPEQIVQETIADLLDDAME